MNAQLVLFYHSMKSNIEINVFRLEILWKHIPIMIRNIQSTAEYLQLK